MMKTIHEQYAGLEKVLKSPIARFMIRRRTGKAKLATLDNFVMPGMHWYLRWHREGLGDEISRDYPALLLSHGPVLEPQMNDNCTIAAFHAILMAETLGLGTCSSGSVSDLPAGAAAICSIIRTPHGAECAGTRNRGISHRT